MKIALIGYGKMGKEIEQIALSRGHSVVLTIDIHNSEELTVENLSKADVAIEPEDAIFGRNPVKPLGGAQGVDQSPDVGLEIRPGVLEFLPMGLEPRPVVVPFQLLQEGESRLQVKVEAHRVLPG